MKRYRTRLKGALLVSVPLVFFSLETRAALPSDPPSQLADAQPEKKPETEAKASGTGEKRDRSRVGKREFAPGILLDWDQQTVELEARVVLRDGPLELLACSPQTKEHESILAVTARPLQIFQAMGLIGLQPGKPPHYDEKQDRWFPASGEPLELMIQWKDGGNDRESPVADWMTETKTGKPPTSLFWVFAGSMVYERERFAADVEGTVVTVVDFESALISPSVRHSADDEELWLTANKERIPPTGTRCTLLIHSTYHPRLEFEVDASGTLRHQGKALSPEEAGRLVEGGRDRRTPFLLVWIAREAEVAKVESIRSALESELVRLKFDPKTSLRFKTEGEEVTPSRFDHSGK